MIEARIIFDFRLEDKRISSEPFMMKFATMPSVGDYIGSKDEVFGNKSDEFLEKICHDCYIEYGCYPQYIREIGYSNGQITFLVGINPKNVLVAWDSGDNKWTISEFNYMPHVGDKIQSSRGIMYIEQITHWGNNGWIEVSLSKDNPIETSANDNAYLLEETNSLLSEIRNSLELIESAFKSYGSTVSLKSMQMSLNEISERLNR